MIYCQNQNSSYLSIHSSNVNRIKWKLLKFIFYHLHSYIYKQTEVNTIIITNLIEFTIIHVHLIVYVMHVNLQYNNAKSDQYEWILSSVYIHPNLFHIHIYTYILRKHYCIIMNLPPILSAQTFFSIDILISIHVSMF